MIKKKRHRPLKKNYNRINFISLNGKLTFIKLKQIFFLVLILSYFELESHI